jgi:hypothetical protein
VRYSWELWDFVDAHPEYFREITEQDKRDGLQTTAMMWAAYEEHRRLEALGTQRSLVGHARLFR